MIHPFSKCIGIELINPLHKIAENRTQLDYKNILKPLITDKKDLFPKHESIIPELSFINGNFFEHDWSDASLVFTNSVCYDNQIMGKIFERANLLKKGSFFINTKQTMPKTYRERWQYITPFKRLFTWGTATIYLYRKII